MAPPLRRAARVVITATARDVTAATVSRPALVLAPHPDDETLGCGATIARKRAAGTPVTVAVLTDGSASHHSAALTPQQLAELRRGELAEAARRLGLPDEPRWAGFPDGALAAHEDEAVAFVSALIDELRPAEVYATSALETHPDHAALGRAARRAVAATTDVELLEYPVWLWGGWPLRAGDRLGSTLDAAAVALRRRARRVRSAEFLGPKLHALEAHASQLGRPDFVGPAEEWLPLPQDVVGVASSRYELFFPWSPR